MKRWHLSTGMSCSGECNFVVLRHSGQVTVLKMEAADPSETFRFTKLHLVSQISCALKVTVFRGILIVLRRYLLPSSSGWQPDAACFFPHLLCLFIGVPALTSHLTSVRTCHLMTLQRSTCETVRRLISCGQWLASR